jgi:serine/threonine protein kinase
MGEVYRARDVRLDRIVALKVLRRSAAGDAGLRGRFEHEARAISKLAHPNICALFDIGEHEGVDFLAAIRFLELAYAQRSQALTFLKNDPLYDRIRSDPRVVDLIARIGFPPSPVRQPPADGAPPVSSR